VLEHVPTLLDGGQAVEEVHGCPLSDRRLETGCGILVGRAAAR
jgi:hypothetical protein